MTPNSIIYWIPVVSCVITAIGYWFQKLAYKLKPKVHDFLKHNLKVSIFIFFSFNCMQILRWQLRIPYFWDTLLHQFHINAVSSKKSGILCLIAVYLMAVINWTLHSIKLRACACTAHRGFCVCDNSCGGQLYQKWWQEKLKALLKGFMCGNLCFVPNIT